MIHSPFIDLNYASNMFNSTDTASHLMQEFLAELTQQVPLLLTYHSESRWQDLRELCHKLHGAACYASTPRLKDLLSTLEQTLIQSNAALYCQEPTAITSVITHIQAIEKCLKQTLNEAEKNRTI